MSDNLISDLYGHIDRLTRELAEWKTDQSYLIACQTIRTLREKLAEAKARAIPDGWVAVNREKLERIADAIFSKRHNAQENGDAYDVGYFGKMLEDLDAMLSSSPDQKESSDVE